MIPYYEIESGKIYNGECLDVLKQLPSESVNCAVTSPPYWALRDYGVEGQLGLESTFQEYIDKLCNIFDEVKRVLRKDGTCWVNLGDTYASGGGKAIEQSYKRQSAIDTGSYPDYAPNSKLRAKMPKCLLQIPARFAIEMCNRGWILRNTIIWHKPNCMPSSAKDRFTVDFEYVFFFVKNKTYWFDRQYDPHLTQENILPGITGQEEFGYEEDYGSKDPNPDLLKYKVYGKYKDKKTEAKHRQGFDSDRDKKDFYLEQGRNKRCVWRITTKAFKGAHFAVFPEDLIETPIKAGCPENGVVLDIFMGSGTTGVVAHRLNRKWIGIELNKEYCKIAKERIESESNQYEMKL